MLAIGGYKGTDPTPELTQSQQLVRTRLVHWVAAGGTRGGLGDLIQAWAAGHFDKTVVDGRTLYDLTAAIR